MSKLRILPHREATEGAVAWGNWWIRIHGNRSLVEDLVKGWDYETLTSFELQPSFDLDVLCGSTGITQPSAIDVVLLLECASLGDRFVARTNLEELVLGQSNLLAVEAPLGRLANSVQLSAHLVVNQWIPDAPDGVAKTPGARLASSVVKGVRLEGDGARFPTEEVSFRALGLEDAAWAVQARFEDLDDNFMSSVRLLVNSDHEAADLLLEPERPGANIAQSVLHMDVARQLLLRVALEPSFNLNQLQDWPEESVGHALNSMSQLYLSHDLHSVVQLARTDILSFERLVQDGFRILKGV